MMQDSKRKNVLIYGSRAFLGLAEGIGFAAQLAFHLMVCVLAKLMHLTKRYILSGAVMIMKAQLAMRRLLQRLRSLEHKEIITTIEKNGTKWIKVEIKGYSLLLGKRKK